MQLHHHYPHCHCHHNYPHHGSLCIIMLVPCPDILWCIKNLDPILVPTQHYTVSRSNILQLLHATHTFFCMQFVWPLLLSSISIYRLLGGWGGGWGWNHPSLTSIIIMITGKLIWYVYVHVDLIFLSSNLPSKQILATYGYHGNCFPDHSISTFVIKYSIIEIRFYICCMVN